MDYEALKEIVNKISPYCNRFLISQETEVSFKNEKGESLVYFILNGGVELIRNADGFLIDMVNTPSVFGLSYEERKVNSNYKLIFRENCSGLYIPFEKAVDLIEKNQLWRHIFIWMDFQNKLLIEKYDNIAGRGSYHQIKLILLDMAGWDSQLRNSIKVGSYIQRKTNLSRSVISEVLSALRKGEYIKMSKGYLLLVNKLPARY